jgi:phage recombination protein Bet
MSGNANTSTNVATIPPQPESRKSLVSKFADKFGIEDNKLMDILKATAFKQRNGQPTTNEQMAALLVVADQYGLNPFTKEIYAFPDQQNGIVPVVGIDGWSRIINSHKEFDGMEFRFSEKTIALEGLAEPIYEWIECIMYRKDRDRPTIIREYLVELYRPPFKKNGSNGIYEVKTPWQSHPRRFSRHKVVIQTARMALGYTGIYDEDEANRIIEGEAQEVSQQASIKIETNVAKPQALEPPQQKPQVIQDLQNVDFETFGAVNEPVQVEHQGSNVEESIPHNAVYQTDHGEISGRDMNMIRQMINFTKDTKSWKNTKDSFEERYSGSTLEFALDELMNAQLEETQPERK